MTTSHVATPTCARSGLARAVCVALAVGVAFAVFVAARVSASDAPHRAESIALESIVVTPSSPGPSTLCQLRVRVANHGDQLASRFRFAVKINGRAIAAYATATYLQSIPPGGSSEIRLYNFWSTETSRPAATSLDLEVALTGADWMKRDIAGGETRWSSIGAVADLPGPKRLSIAIKGEPR